MCWRQFAAQWGDCKHSRTPPLNAIITIIIIIKYFTGYDMAAWDIDLAGSLRNRFGWNQHCLTLLTAGNMKQESLTIQLTQKTPTQRNIFLYYSLVRQMTRKSFNYAPMSHIALLIYILINACMDHACYIIIPELKIYKLGQENGVNCLDNWLYRGQLAFSWTKNTERLVLRIPRQVTVSTTTYTGQGLWIPWWETVNTSTHTGQGLRIPWWETVNTSTHTGQGLRIPW